MFLLHPAVVQLGLAVLRLGCLGTAGALFFLIYFFLVPGSVGGGVHGAHGVAALGMQNLEML